MSNSIPKTTKKLGVYQFGEQIGKGAKGVVFKGINVETAGIVAIKQISIENIGEDGEKAIQMEINLLKKLKHENIVKYIDALSTPTHLHIILEYVDAGCLHSVIDKFGPFPETLVAIYIKQVLQGLDYLHSQGVVHRDIKGANILTTKEGLVKLADFGVATKLVEGEKVNSTNSVVGTPYWMAPEIIEMRGNISTSCDIWSVGCTVIELLTGSPPYFDLNKWSALFRIVQDEHPPIPTGISEGCKDFLFQCFQKEPVLRIDAKGLLKHPWIRNQNHQALDIISNPGNQLPQEVTNTIRLHIDKAESLPFLPKDNNAIVRVQTKSASEEEEVKDYNKKESVKDDYRHGKTWTAAQRPHHDITSEGTTMPHTRGETTIHAPYENQNHENSLYRLTHSTVEGRDSVNRSQNLQDFQRHQMEYPADNSYHQGIDNMKFSQVSMGKQADNFGTLQDGSSFIYGDHPDAFNGAPPNQDNKNIKANIKKMGYVMGATVPQQEYKFVKEISNLLSRLASNSPFTGAANLQDSTQLQDIPRDSTNLGRDSARIPEFGGQYQENISYMQGPGGAGVNVQETLQDLQRLEEIFQEYPVSRDHFMRRYGLTGLTDILEQTEVPEVKEEVLQVINTLTLEDPSLQEKACLFGILPYIIKYASSEHPKDLRVQAARFLGRMSEANDLPFHMFLSAGGFRALVELLDVEYEKNRDLVGFAIEMLGLIFDRKILPIPHLCRIMVKLDVFQRLIIVVGSLYKDARDAADGRESQEAEDFLLKSLGLMNNFAQCEDRNIKGILGEDNNLLALTLYFRKFQCFPNVMAKTAKILCNLSSEPSIMEKFERIKLLPEVLKLISKEKDRSNGPHEEALVELLKLLLQMCQLNPNRQEEVVQNGGVEVLIELKRQGTKNVERYVVSTLCQFVETSERTRKALWDNGGPKLFLDFLDEDYYQPKILDTMALWLEEDPEAIEDILIESAVFNKLVQIFKSANKTIFQQIVPIYLKLIVHSEEFTSRLSKTSEFLREIVERLGMEPNQTSEDKAPFSSKGKLSASKSNKLGNEVYGRKTKRSECINPSALVRKELLDILVHLCIRHENPRGLMNEHNLYPIILQILHLSQNDEMVILTEIATLLLRIYSEGPASSNRYDTASLLDTA